MSEATHPANEPHEQRDVHRRGLLIFAGGFAGFVAISLVLLWLIFSLGLQAGNFASAKAQQPATPDAELTLRDHKENYLAEQRRDLETSRWVDASHRTAIVPIEDAMAMLVARHRPIAAQNPVQSGCPVVSAASPRAADVVHCGPTP